MHYKKVAFWVEQKILLLADLHLGKDAHFRKAGIAIPQVITNEDLKTLQQLIDHFNPKKVLFLGDLFHSDYNRALISFKHFISANKAVDFVLIKGNHDIINDATLESFGFSKIFDEYFAPPFSFTHHPIEKESEYFNFCGHLHPGIILRGKGRQGIRLPAFYFSTHQCVLPAYASFSGKFIIKPTKTATVFAVSDEAVFELQ